jgi:hypothetical protein
LWPGAVLHAGNRPVLSPNFHLDGASSKPALNIGLAGHGPGFAAANGRRYCSLFALPSTALPFFVIRNDSFCHFSAKIEYNAHFTVVYILLLRPIPISGLKRYLRHHGEVAGNLHIELANPLFDLLLKLANNQRVKEFQRKRDFQKCANKKVFRLSNF